MRSINSRLGFTPIGEHVIFARDVDPASTSPPRTARGSAG
jgi:hypothetical protein